MYDDNLIPDFSGDDFANDKNIQKARAAIQAREKMIADSLDVVREKLNVINGAHKNFKGFYMFKSLAATLKKSFRARNENTDLQISLAEYAFTILTGKLANSGTDQYLFGYFTMKNKYPKTYIHKETIKEKIAELFLKQEVDFEHSKKFSRKFYVITEDKRRLQELLLLKNLDSLTAFPDLELELNDNACLFRNSRKPISLEGATIFCELAIALLTVFD